jgi:hypothetical protein
LGWAAQLGSLRTGLPSQRSYTTLPGPSGTGTFTGTWGGPNVTGRGGPNPLALLPAR